MADRSCEPSTGSVYEAAGRVDQLIASIDSLTLALPAGYGDADDELRSARDHLDIARKILRAPEGD